MSNHVTQYLSTILAQNSHMSPFQRGLRINRSTKIDWPTTSVSRSNLRNSKCGWDTTAEQSMDDDYFSRRRILSLCPRLQNRSRALFEKQRFHATRFPVVKRSRVTNASERVISSRIDNHIQSKPGDVLKNFRWQSFQKFRGADFSNAIGLRQKNIHREYLGTSLFSLDNLMECGFASDSKLVKCGSSTYVFMQYFDQ